jgi:flagellar motor switch protein FliN/FliY
MSEQNMIDQLSSMSEDEKLKLIDNIETRLVVEAGAAMITVRDLLKLNTGSVVELDRLAGEHLDIRVNDTLVLKGEIVTIGETLGIRITDVVTNDERAREAR